ncbi:MAG: c-type cytochrome biogenesis protein CcsB [Thermodesulfovibrionales bacterium]|nr:c-type cytochrome biogenesis protein CcsB [Thermodesulfovibrionales bacterium]
MNSSTLFGISTMAYILAMIIYITYLAFRNSQVGIAATTVTIAGFVSQTLAIISRWAESYTQWVMFNPESSFILSVLRSAPLRNLFESLIFFVWCLILGYLIIELKYKTRSFGAFVTPIAGLALAFIDLSGMSKEIEPLVPALQSNWLLVHVVMSFIAYSTFALSFSTGLMYLILKTEKRAESSYIFWTVTSGIFIVVLFAMGLDYLTFRLAIKNPEVLIKSYLFKASFLNESMAISILSLLIALTFIFLAWRYGHILKKIVGSFLISAETLEEITYKSIAIGFPIFTLGGLIFGAIWADQAWGVYWSWDPKETWSLITWFVYAFFLHSRLLRGWRGKKVAIVAVIGFIAVIFTYLGVNLLLSGLHAYGSLE